MLTATTVGWAPAPGGLSGHVSCPAQEVAIRTVKQSSVVRETENGEEGEEEGAEFGEEDLFHQQVGAPGATLGHARTRTHGPCWLDPQHCSPGLPHFRARLALAGPWHHPGSHGPWLC